MHVVVNGWFFLRPDVGSGQYLRRLLSHLETQNASTDNYRFTVLAPAVDNTTSNARDSAPDVAFDIHYLSLPPWPKPLAKLWWEQLLVPWSARRLRANVLWVPYWAGPAWQPCPTVVTVHDLIPALLPAYRGSQLQRIYTWLVSQTARRATVIITVSHASQRDIVRYLRIPADKVYVIHNGLDGVDKSPDQATQEAVRRKFQLPQRYFLYLGGFDVRKNVSTILKAYKQYLDHGGNPDIHMVIAGRLPQPGDALHPDPRQIATDLDLTSFVHFCGYIEEEDKSALCMMATGFLFPSLYEGFGLPVIEAMDAGVPVITSDR